MWRPVLLLVAVLSAGALALVGTPSAASPSKAASELSSETRLAIEELLGDELAAEVRLTSASYDAAAIVASTETGPLYELRGGRGVCLVLPPTAASCGDPADGEVTLSVSRAAGIEPERGDGFAEALASHCTRYAPVHSQDVNCNVWGAIVGDSVYQTPSTALRDLNRINMAASRPWTLCYVGDFCASGTGASGVIGASSGHRIARCYQTGNNVQGRCRTNWHD
jgi:hypothetical protein